jgi:sigma54-dependent transcription regulator
MIRAFFPEQFQSSKQWARWCFVIMLCGSEQLMVDRSDI